MALEVFEPGVAPVQRVSQAMLVDNGIVLFRVEGDVKVSHQLKVVVDRGQESHAFQCPVDRNLGHLQGRLPLSLENRRPRLCEPLFLGYLDPLDDDRLIRLVAPARRHGRDGIGNILAFQHFPKYGVITV